MRYNIGDAIVYPMHGAGVIEGIEEKEVLGSLREYYIMRMPYGDMKVMIPLNNVDGIGIRGVISTAEADEVLESFVSVDIAVNANWNKRFRENMVKIKSGDIYEVGAVLKSLMLRDRSKGLSTGERKMLSNARQIFISEMVMAKGLTDTEIEQLLTDIVDRQLQA
ncbi:MAG: CarD family transcriptional regulator [Oscillospiraceae bacterium]|nr:CarD family transcriptional regulator [Oscillospiraceae bacterium]